MDLFKNTLQALYEERAAITDMQKKLAQRLLTVEQGIESLSALLSDGEVSKPVAKPQAQAHAWSADLPLWRHIEATIDLIGPSKARDIAAHILNQGYETSSKDFANVVGTNLRAYPSKFGKLEDGRWANVEEETEDL